MECPNYSIRIVDIITIMISIIALLTAVLKDFILPCIFKPKFKIDFEDKEQFRRLISLPRNKIKRGKIVTIEKKSSSSDYFSIESLNYNGPTYDVSTGSLSPKSIDVNEKPLQETKSSNDTEINCCFLRISAKNTGRRSALNCRCQILEVKTSSGKILDYAGFTLRWACRPESILDPTNGERLNIGVGETEFIDFAMSKSDDVKIILLKYHGEYVGLKDTIEPGEYIITLIFSGDNFKPYIRSFRLTKENSMDIHRINCVKL